MKHITLGSGGLDIGRVGLGCMGMSAFYTGSDADDAASVEAIHHALEVGVTFFDTAEMYGPYENEVLVGRALKGRRDDAVIATKFGTIRHVEPSGPGLDGRPENVRVAVEGSLERLGVETIDLYYQHRMDPTVPVEETVGALSELIQAGKIRGYGLSEAAPATIRRAHAVHPVTAVQTEYSLWSRDPEQEILPAVRELGIGFVAYSPLGRGFLTGDIRSLDQLDEDDFRRANPRFAGENLQANIGIVERVDTVARDAGATPAQVALAWLLAHGDDIAVIPGTKRASRVEENARADTLTLSAAQIALLDDAPAAVGDRYPDMSGVNRYPPPPPKLGTQSADPPPADPHFASLTSQGWGHQSVPRMTGWWKVSPNARSDAPTRSR